MEWDAEVQEGLQRSNARFLISMNCILENVSCATAVAAGSGRRPAAGGEAGAGGSGAVCEEPRTPVPWLGRAGSGSSGNTSTRRAPGTERAACATRSQARSLAPASLR